MDLHGAHAQAAGGATSVALHKKSRREDGRKKKVTGMNGARASSRRRGTLFVSR